MLSIVGRQWLLLVYLVVLLPVWTGQAFAVIESVRVSSDDDDAEERASNGRMNLSSTDLEFVFEDNRQQIVGMRFTNVEVPNGATVDNAYIEFEVDETDSGSTHVIIYGQAADDAAGFTNTRYDISGRVKTAASVSWSPAAWPRVDATQQTVDISDIIEEIVSRPGWVAGNSLVVIVESGSRCNNRSCQRTAESYRGDSSAAPLLVVDYQPPASSDLIAHYSFDVCDWDATGIAGDSVGGHDGVVDGSVSRFTDPTSGIKPETCSAAEFGGGAIDITGLPVSTVSGEQTTVSFWMNWDGTNSVMPLGWQYHDLWFVSGSFGFNTGNSDIYGIASAGLENGWHHVVAVFTNNQVTNNKLYIDGVEQRLTQRRSSPNNSRAVVSSRLRIGAWWGTNGYRFSGELDEIRVYNGEINQAQIDADLSYVNGSCPNCPPPPGPGDTTLIAEYFFDDEWDVSGSLLDSEAGLNGVQSGAISRVAAPASGLKADTCFAGDFSGGAFDVAGLPVSTVPGDKTSVTFWMYWDGSNSVMPMGWQYHDLWFYGGSFGFNSFSGDIYGIDSSGLANGWHHVAAVFTNNRLTQNKLFIDGVEQTLTQRRNSPNNTRAIVESNLRIGGVLNTTGYRFRGMLDVLKVYNGEVDSDQVLADMRETCALSPVADWHFDEAGWSGIAGEVVDSSGNANHGQSIDTAAGINTIADGKICRAADISLNTSSSEYYAVDTGVDINDDVGSAGAVSLWYRSNSNWNGGNDHTLFDASSNSIYFYLVQRRDGSLLVGLEDSSDGDLRIFTTNQAITADNWVHLVVNWDVAGSEQAQIWLNGNQLATSFGNNGASQDTLGDTFTLYIGDNRSRYHPRGSGNSADGAIDEVLLFDQTLSAQQVANIYRNQDVGLNWDGSARSCPVAGLDHYEITAPASALTCQPTTVTITGHDAGDNAIVPGAGTVINLSTSTANGRWSLPSSEPGTLLDLGGGDARYTFAGNESVSLGFNAPVGASQSVNFTVNSGSSPSESEDPTTAFYDSGFRLVDSALNPISITTLTAGVSSADYYLQAVRSDLASELCLPAFSPGTVSIGVAAECVTPGTCSSDLLNMGYDSSGSASNTAVSTVANNATIGASAWTNLAMDFDADAKTRIALNYTDAGQLTLNARYNVLDAEGNPIAGEFIYGESDFDSKPAGFCVQAINPVTASNWLGCVAADGSCPAFIAAGEAFDLRVTAVAADANHPEVGVALCDNTATDNFQHSGIGLAPSLVWPAAGDNASLATGSVNIVSGGSALVSQEVDNVGLYTIDALTTDYLGGESVSGSSDNIGRFIPHHFRLASSLVTPADTSYSYFGQDFNLSFTLQAVAVDGSTVLSNYDSASSINYGAVGTSLVDSGTVYLTAQLDVDCDPTDSACIGAGDDSDDDATNASSWDSQLSINWQDGVASAVSSAAIYRDISVSTPHDPLANVSLGLLVVDDDGVSFQLADINLDTQLPLAADQVLLGLAGELRQGRLYVPPVYGPEVAAGELTSVPFELQYWDGSGFVINSDDNATRYGTGTAMASAVYSNFTDNLSAGETAIQFPTGIAVVNGVGAGLSVTRPGVGNNGSVDVNFAVDEWLYFDWQGTGYVSPTTTITFGNYRGNDRIIYWREQLR